MSRAFVFPGQGSQFIGMGKELYDNFTVAKDVFDEVDHALDQHLSTLIFSGSQDDLSLTANTQPALMAVSVATTRVLESEGGFSLKDHCQFVAGHSLGEYSALCSVGAFSLEDTAKLLRIRGNAMQEAVPAGKGAMAALIGVEFDDAKAIGEHVADTGICQAANDNGGGQVVISGEVAAVEAAMARATELGIRKVVKLPVSAPFHSSLMQPAATRMAEALSAATVHQPTVPVVANVTAAPTTEPTEIVSLLTDQVTGTVRWRETVLFMKDQGVDQLIELGAGKVLSGLARRIDRSLQASPVQTPSDIEALLAQLSA